MKRLFIFAFLLFAGTAYAQIPPQITGAGAPTNPCINGGQQYLDTTGHNLYVCPSNGANWVNIGIGNATATVMSGNGAPTNPCAGNQLWVNYTSGALYTCNAGSWALVSGGGGSGTVSANNGSVGAIGEYAAAGGSTTIGPTTTLTESPAGTLTVGVAGTTGGVAALAGATSGTVTLTPPAVSGTRTNSLVVSNSIMAGTAGNTCASSNFNDGGTGGIGFPAGANAPSICASNAEVVRFTGGGADTVRIIAAYGMSSAIGTASDTGMSRIAAGLAGIGNGTNGSIAAYVKAGNNIGAVTAADVTCGTGGTLTPCTAFTTITGLSFSLPLSAQNWTFECELIVSQATAAAADQIGVQTATNGATNLAASGVAYTAAGTSTAAAFTGVASTTTAQSIVTFTPAATGTKLPIHIAGTVEGASTAAGGTVLNIQALTGAAADLLTIYRGSWCRVY